MCTCDFCTEHGGVYFSHPQSSATLMSAQPCREQMQGTNTATMLFCATCDDFLGVTCRIDGKLLGAVCIHLFESLGHLRADTRVDVTGRSAEQRVDRWKSVWMPFEISTSVGA